MGAPMARIAMTDRFVAAAKADSTGRTDYFDTTMRGLVLRVTGSGRKTWQFFYTSPRDGKRARHGLGTYPAISLAAARGRALEASTQVQEGSDPRSLQSEQASAAMTVSGLVEVYLADPEQRALRSIDEKERRLEKNVRPVIGSVKIVDLKRRDVRNVTDPILRRGKSVEAARVFEDVRAMLRWAVENEHLERNPIDGMAKPGGGKPRERVLDDAEIRELWRVLPAALPRTKQCQRIIKLCLALGQRVGEIAGMTKSEIDREAGEWRLPGSRTKNGHPHAVPLTALALELIDEAIADAGDQTDFVFPCGKASLAPHAVARTIVRAHLPEEERPLGRFGIEQWSAHDLRRTVLTGMARLGVAPHVIGAVANHRSVTKATVTTQVYVQYSYEREKRAAMELWSDRLRAIIKGGAGAVVQLQRKAVAT